MYKCPQAMAQKAIAVAIERHTKSMHTHRHRLYQGGQNNTLCSKIFHHTISSSSRISLKICLFDVFSVV